MSIPAFDDFNRADGGLGANWTTVTTTVGPAIVGNLVQDSNSGGAFSNAIYTADALWPDNQYAKVTILTLLTDTGRVGGVILRGIATARTGYEFWLRGPLGPTATVEIYKFTAGVSSLLATTGATLTVASTDVFKGSVVSNTLTAYLNDTPILTCSDATYLSGRPGILVNSSVNVTFAQIDTFEAGEVGTTITGLGRRHMGFIYT